MMAYRRAIHFVFKIGRRNEAIGFYKNVLGMKVVVNRLRVICERRRQWLRRVRINHAPAAPASV